MIKCKEKFVIHGGNKLNGEIYIQTSKNSTLPILSACLLTEKKVELYDLPKLTDVDHMLSILKKMGVKIKRQKNKTIIHADENIKLDIDCELSKTMRSSIFLLGSTLARNKYTTITLPGGCQIGKRPIDIHIDSMKKLKVKVFKMGEQVFFDASEAKSGKVKLRLPSVGATENLIMFACVLKGKTTILNPAKEPEIVDLANFLNKMGAKIIGAGTDKITILGVDKLYSTQYTPIGDRIVAGTIACAVAICGGNIVMKNTNFYYNEKLFEILSRIGCQIVDKNGIIHISSDGNLKNIGEIHTGFYPEFATDLQSIIVALACVCEGDTLIQERVFEDRFLTIDQLKLLGANIDKIDANNVIVHGNKQLKGEEIEAFDLRGGASLVLAGLVAKGETIVKNIQFIDRGYEPFESMLSSLGADIKRV